ncbi:uncharacterized protein LOC135651798 [Musa acuminata AAA Group]|uniref:uncharacterized protein LOC135651798 n=1 Tax=Musa acuminata AAA Group TaxID=214697 RepID=UPI0031D5EDFB
MIIKSYLYIFVVEWGLQFGGNAPHLRKVAVRVLSQTASSGCERNWSTFALIHMKVRSRLSYRRLEKLVYVHYNMRLKLRCAELDKELEEPDIDPIDLQFYNEDSEPMLDWVEATENQEDPLFDEAGDPQCPSRFIPEAMEEEEAQPQQVENPPRLLCGRSQAARGTTDTQWSHSSAQRAKAKGKAVASVASLERIESGDETPSQSHSLSRSVQRHDNNTDSNASTDDGGDARQSLVSSTQLEGGEWTEEQYFTHVTQDLDHGTRQDTDQVYARKGKGKTVDEYEQMRQSIHDIDTERGSSYSQPSYYGESYGQQQCGDSWSSFSEQQYDTEQQISNESRSFDIHQYMPQELPRTNMIHDDQSTINTTLMH